MPRVTSTVRVAEVLADLELLDDDTKLTIRSWIERRTGELPPGFAGDVRAWLLVLLEGDARARPRSHSSLYVYFGAVRPLLQSWSVTRGYLREITTDDVAVVLGPLRGWPRHNAISALRSLFRFAKKRGMIFTNPTTRLQVRAADRSLLPMTEAEVLAVEQLAVTPAQRLVVALAAVHTARASSHPASHLGRPRPAQRADHPRRTRAASENSPTRPCSPGSSNAVRTGRAHRTGTS